MGSLEEGTTEVKGCEQLRDIERRALAGTFCYWSEVLPTKEAGARVGMSPRTERAIFPINGTQVPARARWRGFWTQRFDRGACIDADDLPRPVVSGAAPIHRLHFFNWIGKAPFFWPDCWLATKML